MFYQGKKVLVTGGTGFVGTHFVQALLREGAYVRVSVHRRPLVMPDPRVETVSADLTCYEDALRACEGVDYVFHAAGAVGAAGIGQSRTMAAIATNLIVTARVLQAAWERNVPRCLIFGSSTGYPPAEYPIREEEMWSGPTYPCYFGYGWMRRYLERLGEFVTSNAPTRVIVVRPGAIYGPWDNFDPATCHVFPALIHKAVERMDPYVVWGTGNEVRDVLHVSDLIRGCLLAMEKLTGSDPINIGSGEPVMIKDVVREVLCAADYADARVVFDASKPGTIPVRMLDTGKARALLGFRPQMSLAEGISETVRWYREHAGRHS